MEHRGLTGLNVPAVITSPADVTRLHREVVTLDEAIHQQALRTPGQTPTELPHISRLLEELATANKLNLLEAATRKHLIDFLVDVSTNAPVVHLSFAADPSTAFMHKIVAWFRQNIHPSILVRVGLQPNIGAGCILRTTNRYYDLSLREHFKKNQHKLVEALGTSQTR